MHDMVEWITGSVVCGELWYHKPSWGLIVDDVRAERHGEHVIRSPTDKVGRTSVCQSPYLWFCWQMGVLV